MWIEKVKWNWNWWLDAIQDTREYCMQWMKVYANLFFSFASVRRHLLNPSLTFWKENFRVQFITVRVVFPNHHATLPIPLKKAVGFLQANPTMIARRIKLNRNSSFLFQMNHRILSQSGIIFFFISSAWELTEFITLSIPSFLVRISSLADLTTAAGSTNLLASSEGMSSDQFVTRIDWTGSRFASFFQNFFLTSFENLFRTWTVINGKSSCWLLDSSCVVTPSISA